MYVWWPIKNDLIPDIYYQTGHHFFILLDGIRLWLDGNQYCYFE